MYTRFLRIFPVLIACAVLLWTTVSQAAEKPVKVALIFTSIARLNDESFVSTVSKGAEMAAKEFHIDLETHIQPEGMSEYDFMSGIAKKGVDAIVAISLINLQSLMKVAENYENVNIVVVDSVVPPLYTNAKSIIFREHEGSFLVGMVAALKSRTGKIGFIGGRDIPLIRNFAYGYRQGAAFVNPKITIEETMLGTTVAAWDQPDIAKDVAKKQFAQGVDIIFAAAGGSGMGVLEAASEQDGKYAIGVDRNQNGLYPGHVLTSMVKKVDVAVYEALKDLSQGKWEPGVLNLGLKEKALDYAVDVNNRGLLDEALIGIVEAAREQIIRGVIDVKIYSPTEHTAHSAPAQ